MNWREHAHCHQSRRPDHMTPAEWNAIWFPNPEKMRGRRPQNNDSTRDLYGPARAYCHSCPVREECLIDGMLTGERHGMFGGMTPNERRELRWRPRRCRWCDEVFTVTLPDANRHRGGVLPSFCCDEHRELARAAAQQAWVDRRAAQNAATEETECELCGYSSRTASGLWQHMRRQHGEAA